MHEYSFIVKLGAIVRVRASSEDEVRAILSRVEAWAPSMHEKGPVTLRECILENNQPYRLDGDGI